MVYHELLANKNNKSITNNFISNSDNGFSDIKGNIEPTNFALDNNKNALDKLSATTNNSDNRGLFYQRNGWLNEETNIINSQEDSVILECSCHNCGVNSLPQYSELVLSSPPNVNSDSINSLPQNRINSLLTGDRWNNSSTITYSFYESSVFNGTYYGNERDKNVREVSQAVKQNVREILDLVETFVDIDFVEVAETDTSTYGQIRYMLSDAPNYAYAYTPGNHALAGDVHLRASYDNANNTNGFRNDPGRHGYTTLIHETFHALGLDHPHSGTVLNANLDNMSNTVMTYDFTGNSPATAMPYDIAALQYLYGAAENNTGNTTYTFGSTTDVYRVNGQTPFSTSHRVKQTIWDSAGNDTLDFSGLSVQSQGYLFDLNEGGWLIANNQRVTRNSGETFYKSGSSLAYDMTIENVVNSRSDDRIIANGAANTFRGYAPGKTVGNDVLENTNSLDTLDLSAYRESDVTQSQNGNDLVINLGADGSVRVKNYYATPATNRLDISLTETSTTPVTNSNAIAEVGTVTNADHNQRTITLQNDYVNPVVFAQPLSYNGADPSTIRITNINAANDTFSFYVQEAEYRDGRHITESFSYMVVEAGTWQLDDGTIIEVGTVNTNKIAASDWENVSFNGNFAQTPAILSQVQTNNDSEFVRTRQNNANANGFSLAMEEEEALRNSGHQQETVGWLAMSSSRGEWDGLTYQAGNTGDVVTHDWHELDFGNFASTPNLLASIATYDGPDASGLRYRDISGAGSNLQIKVEEEQSQDSEIKHTTENISFLAIEGNGSLTAQAYDPLNSAISEADAMTDSLTLETDFI